MCVWPPCVQGLLPMSMSQNGRPQQFSESASTLHTASDANLSAGKSIWVGPMVYRNDHIARRHWHRLSMGPFTERLQHVSGSLSPEIAPASHFACCRSHFIAVAASMVKDDNENTLVQEALPDLLFPEDAFVPGSSIMQSDVLGNFPLPPPFEPTGPQTRDSHPPHIRSDMLDDFPSHPSTHTTSTQARDSYVPHICNNYLTNQVMGSGRPAWHGEKQWGKEFDRIFHLSGTQKLLHKLKKVKVSNKPLPSTPALSTSAPPASVSASAPPMPTPTASDVAPTTLAVHTIPANILKALKKVAQEDLCRYALTQQPVRCDAVSAYSLDVAIHLLNDHTPSPGKSRRLCYDWYTNWYFQKFGSCKIQAYLARSSKILMTISPKHSKLPLVPASSIHMTSPSRSTTQVASMIFGDQHSHIYSMAGPSLTPRFL